LIADFDIHSEGKFSLEIFFEFFGSELPARSFPTTRNQTTLSVASRSNMN